MRTERLTRRRFLKVAGLAGAALATGSAGLSRAQAQRARPNILFIMSDDHCAQAIGAYGGRLAKLNPTPTIDTLAREGMRFENAFCTNSICTPSRACIMTGQYSQTNGVLTLDERLASERHTLPIEMNKAGYQTAMIGKWHLKDEPAHFDYYKVLPGQGKYHNPEFREKGKGPWRRNVVKHRGHSSDVITDIALDWFEDRRDEDKPFWNRRVCTLSLVSARSPRGDITIPSSTASARRSRSDTPTATTDRTSTSTRACPTKSTPVRPTRRISRSICAASRASTTTWPACSSPCVRRV